ncbi:hypothetical protein CDAR_419231 [Caerostris darwini]|uniref:Uncharacterized protein n=1 Tax=Caerostris darwini TaxID=1538125 RepID=A0AAV4TLX7_9ARAC|nr:hypothetical protein CDAR_419231 [Caerostris darwini]
MHRYVLEKTPGYLQTGSRDEGQGQDVDEDEEEGVVALPHLIRQVDEAGQPGDLPVGTLQCVVEGSGRVQKGGRNAAWDDPDHAQDSFGPGFRLVHAGFQWVKHCHVSEMKE